MLTWVDSELENLVKGEKAFLAVAKAILEASALETSHRTKFEYESS